MKEGRIWQRLKTALIKIFIDEGVPKRTLIGAPKVISIVIGVSATLAVFYTAFRGLFTPLVQNSLFLCPILAMTFMYYPARKFTERTTICARLVYGNIVFGVLIWTLANVNRLNARMWYASPVHMGDKIFGVVLIVLVLIACRRTVGVIVESLAIIAIAYAFLGPSIDGLLGHSGMTFKRFIDIMCMTTEGVYGSLTGICATTIYGFIAFSVSYRRQAVINALWIWLCVSR